MAAKRVKLCFDVLPIRSKDHVRHWGPKISSNRCQQRHLTVEAASGEAPAEAINGLASHGSRSTPSPTTYRNADLSAAPFPVISSIPLHLQPPTVSATLYSFPTLEPLRFVEYPHNHLALPLRRDLLHRAVVYEGDNTRQGTAATKHRFEINGSKRKLRPQKGTGRARLGDRSSPMLRGGGRAFDKKARDFGTGLPRKVYDVAWRTALSYRYAQGQLVVVDTLAVEEGEELAQNVRTAQSWVEQVFPRLGWMKKGGGSLLLAANSADEVHMQSKVGLFKGLNELKGWGRGLMVDDVDVKDLLKGERVVVEKQALDLMLKKHQSDLTRTAWEAPR